MAVRSYSPLSKRDRRAGNYEQDKRGGGITLFVLSAVAKNITLLEYLKSHERICHILYADLGPILFFVFG